MRPSIPVLVSFLVAVGAATLVAGDEEGSKIRFEPVPDLGGADRGGTSRGVAWGDFTGNGYPDLVVSNTGGERLFLYRNAEGSKLEPVTGSEVTGIEGHAQGVNWVDVDNDGDLDLFVAREHGVDLLFTNDAGSLRRQDAGALTENALESVQGCWADFDGDGLLDVFVVHADYQDDVLYRNLGGARFSRTEGPWEGLGNHGRACAWSDVDGDGRPDLYVANAYTQVNDEVRTAANLFYRNLGNGTFERIVTGEAVNYHAYSYGVSFMDFDQDGDEDLFVSSIGRFDPNMLFENVDGSLFHPVRASMLVRDRFGPVKGHAWGDFENDGDVDLFVAEGHGGARPEHAPFDNADRLYENVGGGEFRVADLPILTDHDLVSAGAAAADFDRDGDLDLFIANWGDATEDGSGKQDNQLFENVSNAGRWFVVRLEGTRSNRMGIGARVRITTGEGEDAATQYRTLWSSQGFGSMGEPLIHVGLGDRERVRELRIDWPSGTVDTHRDLRAGERYVATEAGAIRPEGR
ncbi:MAG: CRTAC1 family protein [bacterium]